MERILIIMIIAILLCYLQPQRKLPPKTPSSRQVSFRGFRFVVLGFRVCPKIGCREDFQPCLNGATCQETCSDVKQQCTCACSEHYHGNRCEVFQPMLNSCQAMARIRQGVVSGIYNFNVSGDKTVKTYCDFTSDEVKA